MTYDFSGKVAVITGSAGGIGQAYAAALAAAGAAVVVADIDADGAAAVADGINAEGGTAMAYQLDVADPVSATAMVAAVTDVLGGIDYLVNNAAIFGTMQLDLLISVDWEYLQRFLSVNLLGALNCTRACYRSMRKRGGGAVVNQSSTAAYVYAGFYGLAKAGVNSLTQQLAHELGGMGIRVNAIAAGPDRHRGRPDGRTGRLHRADRRQPRAQAPGDAGRPGRDVPVPALRRRVVDHRPHLQRRRRPDHAGLTGARRQRRRRRTGPGLRPPGRPQRLQLPALPGRHRGDRRRDGRSGGAGGHPDWPGQRVHRRTGLEGDGRDRRRHRAGRDREGVPRAARRGRSARQAAPRRGQRPGHRARVHDPRPLRPRARRRVGPAPRAVRRDGRPAGGGQQLPVPGPDGPAGRGPDPARRRLGDGRRGRRARHRRPGLPRRPCAGRHGRPRPPHRRLPPGRGPGDQTVAAGAARRGDPRSPGPGGRGVPAGVRPGPRSRQRRPPLPYTEP